MKIVIYTLSILISINSFSQEPVVLKVIKNSEQPRAKESTSLTVPHDLEMTMGRINRFHWVPLLRWSQRTSKYQLDADLFPAVSVEYDLSKNETAHFYNLGVDVGREGVLGGISARIPNHNPELEDAGGIELGVRAVRTWDINRIGKTTKLRVAQRRLAQFQMGVEYIFSTSKTKDPETNSEQKRKAYASPFIAAFHPVYDRLLLGLRYRRNLDLNPSTKSYSAISLDVSYFIDI